MSHSTDKLRLHPALSREGVLFLFFLCALLAAAVYSGNNGLVLLFCTLFSVFIVLLILAWRNFQPLSIQRKFIEEIFAVRDARIDLHITNNGNRTVWGLRIYEKFEDERTIGPMFVRKIAPGETLTARYMCRFPMRGNARFCGFELRSRFPLPFLELRADVIQAECVAVYPQPQSGIDAIAFAGGKDRDDLKKYTQHETSLIREIQHGRKTGRILWKLSARRQRWIEEISVRKPQHLITPTIDVRSRNELGSQFESQISQITNFVLKKMIAGQQGIVRIHSKDYPYGGNAEQRRALLSALAQFDPPAAHPLSSIDKKKDKI